MMEQSLKVGMQVQQAMRKANGMLGFKARCGKNVPSVGEVQNYGSQSKNKGSISELESEETQVSVVTITKENVKGLEVDKSPRPNGLYPRVLKKKAEVTGE
eukprot:g35953.t1